MRRRAASVAALLAAALLILGSAGLVLHAVRLTNWLAMLFAIDRGVAPLSSLRAIRFVDIALLALTSAAFAGFWPGIDRARRVWMSLAATLPIAGMAVLAATGLAGRSGLMGGGLVLSALMLAERSSRRLGLLGLAANTLLLVGDFGTSGSPAPAVAGVVVVGYALLVAWFLAIAVTLTRRASVYPA